MLHNIIQSKKNPISDRFINEDDDAPLEQPDIQDMARNFTNSNLQGEVIRNTLRAITDELPLRKQITINRK